MQTFFLEYSSGELASTHLDCVHVFLSFFFFFSLLPPWLYYFPTASVTKYHKLEKVIFSQFWRLTVRDQVVGRAGFLGGLPPWHVGGHRLPAPSCGRPSTHVCVLTSSACKDTSPVGWRPTWLNFTKHAHLFQDPGSKHSHILRCCGQDGTCECGGYMEPVAPPYLWDRFFPLGHTERLLDQLSLLLDVTDLGTFLMPLVMLLVWHCDLRA